MSAPVRPRFSRRRWMTASAAVAVAVGLFALEAVTAPRRAIGDVAASMAKVRRFHLRMELPRYAIRYEGWGEREVGARVEEWEDGQRSLIVLDDGKKLRSFYPGEQRLDESDTRLHTLFRHAAGFNASRMLLQSARGKLFEGQSWLGEATAREVSRVIRHGVPQRRIHVDLQGGFFERMVIYSALPSDRLTQANLYTDSESPDEEPFARVFFDYPEELDPDLFRLEIPHGTRIDRDAPSPLR